MKKLVFAFCLLSWLPVKASHIVGGEFELLHITGYNYRLNMILYFDVLHGNKGAFDPTVTAEFYSKNGNFHIMSVIIPFSDSLRVSYTQQECAVAGITNRLFYTISVYLSPSTFNDPEGYYISWQRCCRNYSITNIYSDNPANGGLSAGQTFYLEFPPVIRNGVQFINSSPHLFPPLNDYACAYRPYYIDFTGTDDDNDSVVYSLVTPLNTTTFESLPAPLPGPYPRVIWRNPPYDSAHIVGGFPDLKITKDGLLTVTPKGQTGLFIFAVKVEEFRDKQKIGETRRDFQMYVIDGPSCAPDDPPLIVGKKLTDVEFNYVDTMSVDFANTVPNATRCIQIKVTDPQSLDPYNNFTENIKIRVKALNFINKEVGSILPAEISATLVNGSSKIFTICFPECPFINGPYEVGIIAADDACSLPMLDTLRVTVNAQPPPNTFAYFLPPKETKVQLDEGQSGSWPFTAKDDDGDDLMITVLPDGFALKDAGMTYHSNLQPGLANGSIDWNAFCKLYDFAKKTDFTVRLLVDDVDKCNIVHYDTALFNFKIVLPKSNPVLTIYNEDKTKDLTNSSFETNLGHVTLDLVGVDQDAFSTDTLKLSLLGATGTISPSNYTFASARGFRSLESVFSWDTDCSIFKEGNYDNYYTFKFIFSNNHCLKPTADTASVNIEVKDIESDMNFVPPNVITANGDNCNDFFGIDGFEGAPECNGTPRTIPFTAPLDNCTNRFEQVRIYNRWGKSVFQSTDRKFRWYAADESAGVYYYFIKFTRAEYKSSITVIH